MSNDLETKREILMEKQMVVAPDKCLGGIILESEGEAETYKRIQQIIFCNVCGDRLDEKNTYALCKYDGKFVCPTCSVKMESKNMCLDCLKTEYPLSKEQYVVALSIRYGINNIGVIHRLSKIPKNQIRDSKNFLYNNGLASRDFLGCFKITSDGESLLNIYGKVYDLLKEIADFKEEIE